jgi:hypothetical protein
VSRKPSPFAAADQLAYRNALIRELRDQRDDLLAAAEKLLDILAEPEHVQQHMGADNAIQALADVIARVEATKG